MKLKTVLSISAWSMVAAGLLACSDPPPVADPVESIPDIEEVPVDTVAETSVPEVNPMEAERARLEDMLNKLMSEDVYFNYDKSKLTQNARDLLAQVGDILIKNGDKFDIVVEGHTDLQGTESYNMALGSKRANAVRGYLVDYGVSDGVISTTSYGEQSPKVNGESDSAHAKNRRAHFQVNLK
jgi:peptidoglycan-associated lipoprotein